MIAVVGVLRRPAHRVRERREISRRVVRISQRPRKRIAQFSQSVAAVISESKNAACRVGDGLQVSSTVVRERLRIPVAVGNSQELSHLRKDHGSIIFARHRERFVSVLLEALKNAFGLYSVTSSCGWAEQ